MLAETPLKPPLQPHIVQPQRMSNRIQAVFPGKFARGLPQRLRELRPMRLRAAKLIKPPLQLHDWLGDRDALLVEFQPASAAD